jgi:AcrR family transcriptional regulator
MTTTTTSKRERLIEAAKELFHQQGVSRSTLADIAQHADVPLGNVYYHFRTKEALVDAVLQAHMQELRASFARWERYPDPHQRLCALLVKSRDDAHTVARYGCVHGSLSQELEKDDNQLASIASQLMQLYLEWAESQFRQLGKDEQEAKDLALDMISSLQGTFLLTNGFRSPALLERKLQHMEQWIRSL